MYKDVCDRCGKYDCVTCIKGFRGPAGPRGQQGAQGPPGATGPTGPTGPTGEGFENFGLLPFSTGKSPIYLGVREDGTPRNLYFVTFSSSNGGGGYDVEVNPADWNAGIIVPTDSYRYTNFFVLPRDLTINKIVFESVNIEEFNLEDGGIIRPFILLATLDTNTKIFTIIQETICYAEPFVGTADPILPLNFKFGSLDNINYTLPENTILVMAVGIVGENLTEGQELVISGGGGISFE